MKLLQVTLAVAAFLFSMVSLGEEYRLGQHYKEVASQTMPRNPNKIEVVEAFWYGCGHCNSFEPTVQAWKKSIQSDVDFYQIPAQFSRAWKIHAELFYLTKVLKVNEKVHQAIFNSIHMQREPLYSESDQQAFLAQYGVSEEDFEKYNDSFMVRRHLKMADEQMRSWGISGVPAIVVNGKYVVDATSAGGQHKIFDVVNYLIEKERQLLKS
ncbi:thiol:disulfide interchange protein DsbA/DsbL [Bermanella sp. R86510]|uniref:thiol:disulfide interchange protein DsbA/DsbL n=1 Tax=unclassified Bermanella TaxID=2627862 RepID=UPI0037CB154C